MEGGDSPGEVLFDLHDVVRKRVLRTVDDLHRLGISDVLQARILACLFDGRRTVAELVEELYGCRNPDPGYMSAYSKTRRGIRELESKGYVATRMLGRDKPYRLTSYAISRLSGLASEDMSIRLVPWKDIAIHTVSLILLFFAIGILIGSFELIDPYLVSFYAAFFTMTGVSVTRLVETVSRVM